MSAFFVEFYSLKNTTHDEPILFIDRDYPTSYNCDNHEGTFTFNGYYYVENHPPPYVEDMKLKSYERPFRYSHYLPKTLGLYIKSNTTSEEHYYVVEIYKMTLHENTNKYSTINDDDDSEIHVCFFPTHNQTVHFKILETLK
jgi:hypothetical protein